MLGNEYRLERQLSDEHDCAIVVFAATSLSRPGLTFEATAFDFRKPGMSRDLRQVLKRKLKRISTRDDAVELRQDGKIYLVCPLNALMINDTSTQLSSKPMADDLHFPQLCRLRDKNVSTNDFPQLRAAGPPKGTSREEAKRKRQRERRGRIRAAREQASLGDIVEPTEDLKPANTCKASHYAGDLDFYKFILTERQSQMKWCQRHHPASCPGPSQVSLLLCNSCHRAPHQPYRFWPNAESLKATIQVKKQEQSFLNRQLDIMRFTRSQNHPVTFLSGFTPFGPETLSLGIALTEDLLKATSKELTSLRKLLLQME